MFGWLFGITPVGADWDDLPNLRKSRIQVGLGRIHKNFLRKRQIQVGLFENKEVPLVWEEKNS
jgi:hypothetical protein